jgi:hypothetical protein
MPKDLICIWILLEQKFINITGGYTTTKQSNVRSKTQEAIEKNVAVG